MEKAQPHNYCRPDIEGYGDVKRFHDFEVGICRLGYHTRYGSNLFLERGEDCYVIKQPLTYHYNADNTAAVDRIIYFDDGRISVNLKTEKRRYWHGVNLVSELLSHLPQSIHIYGKTGEWFIVYDPEADVRRFSYDVEFLYKTSSGNEEDVYVFNTDGTISGADKVERGAIKFCEDKPIKDHLNAKHLKEMAKARLDNDFVVEYEQLYASFRGMQTGRYHMCITLSRSSSKDLYNAGPNSGLIRKIHVARFVKDPEDLKRAEMLALSITKDIPESSIGRQLKKLRGQDNAI